MSKSFTYYSIQISIQCVDFEDFVLNSKISTFLGGARGAGPRILNSDHNFLKKKLKNVPDFISASSR
jgi:hypothetical protein